MDNDNTALERLRSMLNVPPANRPPDWINPLEKIEQLLTCSICLDRYKNPKLLPCQHTFCLEPCLEGLVDNVRRIIKCPECRAEHPLPYDNLKAFQTNYSLMGFLEIHLQATEENAGELEAYIRRYNLERCSSCDEKAEVEQCAHCNKKICATCRTSHTDLLKRDLGRLLNQVKRVANRIHDSMEILSRNTDNLQMNCELVKDEVRDYVRRFTKELKKREDSLITEIEAFQLTENRLAANAKENLELESNTINESCEKVESCIKGECELPDDELVKFKQIFTDGLEHLRTVNVDADDICNKKIRFFVGPDPHLLPHAISQFGELQVCGPQLSQKLHSVDQVYVPRFTHIKNVVEVDHRYPATVKKRQWGDPSEISDWTTPASSGYKQQQEPTVGRKVAQPVAIPNSEDGGYSSRFRRRQLLEEQAWNRLKAETNVSGSSRLSPSRHSDTDTPSNSGYVSSPRSEAISSSPRSADILSSSPNAAGAIKQTIYCPPQFEPNIRSRASQQINDAEPNHHRQHRDYERQHQQSSRESAENHRSTRELESAKQIAQRELESAKQTVRSWAAARTELAPPTGTSHQATFSGYSHAASSSGTNQLAPTSGANQLAPPSSVSPPSTSPSPAPKRRIQRQETEDEELNQRVETIRKTWEDKQRSDKEKLQSIAKKLSDHSLRSKTCELPIPIAEDAEGDVNDNMIQVPITVYRSHSRANIERPRSAEFEAPVVGDWKKYLIPNPVEAADDANDSSVEAAAASRPAEATQNRFVRSRTNPDFIAELLTEPAGNEESNAVNVPAKPERHNRFKRKAEKSHTSSHVVAQPKFTIGDNESSPRFEISIPQPTHGTPGNRLYRVFTTPTIDYLQKGQLHSKFGCKGSADDQFNWPRGIAVTPTTGDLVICDSSNHRLQVYDKKGTFVKTIGSYGSGPGEFDCLAGVCVTRYGQIVVSDRYNHRVQMFDANGRFLREFGTHGQTNGRFNNPWGLVTDGQGFIYVCDKDNHRIQMFQADGSYGGKFGVNGSKEGQFQNPHFIAINKQNQLIITDSSNHRVQVFDHGGNFLFMFGSEGFHEGEFKYPRGVAVDEQGFITVADSGNNRVQVFYPDGRFLTMFGSWGSTDGQFKGVEGVVVSGDGRIIVTDRENHRVQIF